MVRKKDTGEKWAKEERKKEKEVKIGFARENRRRVEEMGRFRMEVNRKKREDKRNEEKVEGRRDFA